MWKIKTSLDIPCGVFWVKMDVITRQRERDHRKAYLERDLLGASVRNSDRGKGHEEGGSAYEKAGSSLFQESPWKFSSIYPQNQSLPTLLLCALTYTSDFIGGGLSPTTSLWKRVNLQFQLIKFLGVTRVFQPTNSFRSPLACLNRFFQLHVIVQSLPTVRDMRCSKLSKYRFLWAVKRLIRNCFEGFFTCWANVCC